MKAKLFLFGSYCCCRLLLLPAAAAAAVALSYRVECSCYNCTFISLIFPNHFSFAIFSIKANCQHFTDHHHHHCHHHYVSDHYHHFNNNNNVS